MHPGERIGTGEIGHFPAGVRQAFVPGQHLVDWRYDYGLGSIAKGAAIPCEISDLGALRLRRINLALPK